MDNGNTLPVERLLTYRQAAKILQVSDRSVWTLVKSGELKSARIGRCVRIDPRDLDEFVHDSKDHSR